MVTSGGLKGSQQEIIGEQRARLPSGIKQMEGCAEAQRDGWHAGGDVIPAATAANRAAIAHLAIAHVLGRIAQRGVRRPNRRGARNFHVTGHRTGAQRAIGSDPLQFGDRLQVDHAARTDHARLHRLHHALAAGHEDGIAGFIGAQDGYGLLQGPRPLIVLDYRWIHVSPWGARVPLGNPSEGAAIRLLSFPPCGAPPCRPP